MGFWEEIVFNVIFLAIVIPCVIFLYRQLFLYLPKYLKHEQMAKKWNNYKNLIEELDGCHGEIERIKELMPEFLRVDMLLKQISSDFDALEILALRVIVRFQYNELLRKINSICNGRFPDDRELKNLLPRCTATDTAIKTAFDDELPKKFISLEHFVRAQLASGDISDEVLV